MTETTQETIKFARNWLKNGTEDEPSLVVVCDLAKAVVELADESEALNYANAGLGVKINGKKAKIKNLVSELAALKEKYRWRNVDEEPPRETEVLICCVSRSGAHKYVYTASFDGEDFYDRRGDSPSGEVKFWRPLDLPKEDGGDNDKN